jgi:hypothetical protein
MPTSKKRESSNADEEEMGRLSASSSPTRRFDVWW